MGEERKGGGRGEEEVKMKTTGIARAREHTKQGRKSIQEYKTHHITHRHVVMPKTHPAPCALAFHSPAPRGTYTVPQGSLCTSSCAASRPKNPTGRVVVGRRGPVGGLLGVGVLLLVLGVSVSRAASSVVCCLCVCGDAARVAKRHMCVWQRDTCVPCTTSHTILHSPHERCHCCMPHGRPLHSQHVLRQQQRTTHAQHTPP